MRALIVGNRDSSARKLRSLVDRLGYECNESDVVELELGAEYAGRLRRELVVVVISAKTERALAVVREIRAVSQGLIVAIGPADDPKFILRTLHDGADEYIDVTEGETDMERLLQRVKLRREATVGHGLVTCLLGAVGGSGASTIAANLGVALALKHPTMLFDLCMRANDLATLLDVKPRYTIADLCRREERLDGTMMEQALMTHSSGVRVLAVPTSADDRMRVTSDGIRRCIALARGIFEHTILDVDRSLGAEQVAAIVRADVVLLVVRLDVVSLRNVVHLLDVLDELGIRRDRIRLIGNRIGQKYALSPKRFEQALDLPFWQTIRDDIATANRALNDGTPAATMKPRSLLARGINDMAAALTKLASEAAPGRSLKTPDRPSRSRPEGIDESAGGQPGSMSLV